MIRKTHIKTDLIEQLERKGIHGNHYLDLINDYITLWDLKKMLIKDIKERGVSVEYNNGGGQTGFKKNDSLSELIKVNSQMLRILGNLGLKASELEVDDDDDDEM